jgi:hypothetical protein
MDPNQQVTHFAKTNFRNEEKVFGIKAKDRMAHMYMIGKTGTGKSTLLLNMMVSDMRMGNGIGLIDPHGDLAEEVLRFVPKERINDVIYFNPVDMDHPIAFNPLEKTEGTYDYLIASGLISVFKKIWYEYWGPRLEHILRNSILTLLEWPGTTLLDIQRLLTNREFRRRAIERVRDPQLKEFWLYEFERYSPLVKSDAVSPILNKVGQFLASVPIRNIIGQRKSSFDLREILDQKKILIANLSKGRIGEDACQLLGALLITKIELSALSRTNIQEEKRNPFYLYIDEIHSFLTLSFADILSEARKYGLALVLAHQYIEQLDEKIRRAILGNVGTIISFRVGAQDARYLAQEFYPVFDESDLVSLPNYHIYLKLMIDGVTSKPFSAVTLLPPGIEDSDRGELI